MYNGNMARVRPRGWGFLLGLCICTDALQMLMGLIGTMVALSGVGIVISFLLWGLTGVMTIFLRIILFIWHDHNELPSHFGHMLFTTIAELMLGIVPFWTLYALTYRVEEKAKLPEDGQLYPPSYFPSNEPTE